MVNFRKRLEAGIHDKKTDPIEIYDSLDRASDKGPLRPAQHSILSQWYSTHRVRRDVILKLHTGQGKTLIGLLILQSRINNGDGPAIYVCPTIQLVEQTCEQAKQFGIKYCRIDEFNVLPNDFMDGKVILISHVQKLFNGKTIFRLKSQSISIDSIVLDDSHACIDTIREAFCIQIQRADAPYQEILSLFEEDLEVQGIGLMAEIKTGEYSSMLPVPYWAWQDKISEVTAILVKYKDLNSIKFPWELLKDSIVNCQCYISGASIEISPCVNLIDQFGTFSNANHRVLMSATNNNDAFFIKGLGLSKDTVIDPLVFPGEKWSGEKLILIPYFISDQQLDATGIVNYFAPLNSNRKYGVVVLTSSYTRAKYWHERGAAVSDKENIEFNLKQLKSGGYEKTVVMVNRYDGIDLPDDACRILIVDTKPIAQNHIERYQEGCRQNSDQINIRVAQKIEQGLGRGVRGEKDYCVVLLNGTELINTVRNPKLNKFFSPQTKKQIEIGFEVTKFVSEDAKTNNGIELLYEVINQCLLREDDWKLFYATHMDGVDNSQLQSNILDILEIERLADSFVLKGDINKAVECIQKIIDTLLENDNATEKGWYFQEMARLYYLVNASKSNEIQLIAHRMNRSLLKPRSGMVVQKLNINLKQTEQVFTKINSYSSHSELTLDIDAVLSDLSFGVEHNKFEKALCDVGKLIGFESEQPDKEWKEGPDVLWNIRPNSYLLFECKNEVKEERKEIHRDETGQMNNSCAWFKKVYGSATVKCIMVIPTKVVAKGAGFNEDVEILRRNGLKELKKNIRAFFRDLSGYSLIDFTHERINQLLSSNQLDVDTLLSSYWEKPNIQ